MIRRSKTRHRLLILLAIAAVVILGVAGLIAVRQAQIKTDLTKSRADGMAAMEQKDYETALHALGRYLQRYPEDMEVALRYAQARRNVPRPNARHLTDAISVLRRVVATEPDNLEAGRELLELYTRVGYFTEAAELAQSLVRYAPFDADLLDHRFRSLLVRQDFAGIISESDRIAQSLAQATPEQRAKVQGRLHLWRAEALRRQGKLVEALAEVDQHTATRPDKLHGYLLTFDILHEMTEPSAAYLERLQQWKTQEVDARILTLLEARAHRSWNDTGAAVALLQNFDAEPILDVQYVRALLNEYDQLNLFNRSLDLLYTVAGKLDDPGIQLHAAERLLQNNRIEQFQELLQQLDMEHHIASVHLLAFQALAKLNTREPIDDVLAKLEQRIEEPAVGEWMPLLRMVKAQQSNEKPSLADRLKTLKEAVERRPENAFAQHFLALTYREAGEPDLAVSAWRNAIINAPTWALPRLELARTLLMMNQPLAAAQFAETARQRAPGNGDAFTLLVTALAAGADQLNDSQVETLRPLIDNAANLPQVPEPLLVPTARLLVRAGDVNRARALIEKALALDPPPSVGILQNLINFSRQFELGLEDACLAVLAKQDGGQTVAALAQINELRSEGRLTEALAALRKMLADAPAHQRPQLQLMHLQLLDMTSQTDQAIALGRDLLAAYADQRGVLEAMLQSSSIWQDRDLTRKVIDRLKAVSPANSVAVQVYDARWQLAGSPDNVQLRALLQQLNELVRQAPTRTDLRLALSQVHVQLGDMSAAVQQFREAVRQNPNDIGLLIELARLHIAAKDPTQARMVLQGLQQRAPDDPQLRTNLAYIYAEIGDRHQALTLAEAVKAADDPQGRARLLVATLYQQQGRLDDARRIYDELLAQPPSVPTVLAAASFYLAQQDSTGAMSALEKLSLVEPDEVRRHVIRGGFWTGRSNFERALEHYQQAIAIDPTSTPAWIGLLQAHLAHSDLPTIRQVLERAEQVGLSEPRIAFLLRQRSLIDEMQQLNMLMRGMLTGLLDAQAAEREAVRSMLIAILAYQRDGQISDAKINELTQLADRFPHMVQLQIAMAVLLNDRGAFADAATRLERLTRSHPQLLMAQEMLVQARARAGQFAAALTTANSLRETLVRMGQSTQAIDTTVAELLMSLKRPQEAVNILQPHAESPDAPSQVLTTYANALMTSGRYDQARRVLEPHLSQVSAIRIAWLSLAAEHLPDAVTLRRWIADVQAFLEPNDVERLNLANAWQRCAVRFNDDEALQQAIALLDELVSVESPLAAALLLRGAVADYQQKFDEAERWYRAAIEKDERSAVTMNNLAMVLSRRADALDEALQFAERAVALAPNQLEFMDSLATIHQKRNDHEAALATWNRIAQMDPDNPRWLLAQAKAYRDLNQIAEARRLLNQAEARIATGGNTALRDQARELRLELDQLPQP